MKVRVLLTLAGLAIGTAVPVLAREKDRVDPERGPIITFDAPGAGTGSGTTVLQGTFPTNINGFGVAIGYFVDANIVPHGFVRYPFGQMTTIDAPGAGMVPGANQGTVAYSINIEGTIAGQYQDTNFVFHCFLRYPDGHIITFDAPGAGTGPNQGSEAVAINLEGTVAGITIDNNNVLHGFVRSALGTFTSFDAPNASMTPNAGPPVFQGTFVTLESSLNVQGEIIGWYFDAKSAAHGYLRKSNGTFIEFDPPSSANTYPGAINSEGLIVGGAADSGGVLHGFVRSVNGAITTFDVPGAGSTLNKFEGTLALGVSSFGLSTGYWVDSNSISHGFIRHPNGRIFKFDAPGAGAAPGTLQGTVPQGMNFWGEIVGYLIDTNNVSHGFIRIP
jgi:hypothetical protein